jgi:hypothetical protein
MRAAGWLVKRRRSNTPSEALAQGDQGTDRSTWPDELDHVDIESHGETREPRDGRRRRARHDLPEVTAADCGAIGQMSERDLPALRNRPDVGRDAPLYFVHAAGTLGSAPSGVALDAGLASRSALYAGLDRAT